MSETRSTGSAVRKKQDVLKQFIALSK